MKNYKIPYYTISIFAVFVEMFIFLQMAFIYRIYNIKDETIIKRCDDIRKRAEQISSLTSRVLFRLSFHCRML